MPAPFDGTWLTDRERYNLHPSVKLAFELVAAHLGGVAEVLKLDGDRIVQVVRLLVDYVNEKP